MFPNRLRLLWQDGQPALNAWCSIGNPFSAEIMAAQILAFAMVETAEAFGNLEAIAATPGLDGIYVGPADLTFSMSAGRLPIGMDRQEPEMIAAIRRIADVCRDSGIRAGLHCGTPEYAARAVSWGFGLVTVGGDVRFLAGGAAEAVDGFRKLTGRAGPDSAKGGY